MTRRSSSLDELRKKTMNGPNKRRKNEGTIPFLSPQRPWRIWPLTRKRTICSTRICTRGQIERWWEKKRACSRSNFSANSCLGKTFHSSSLPSYDLIRFQRAYEEDVRIPLSRRLRSSKTRECFLQYVRTAGVPLRSAIMVLKKKA